MVKKTVNELEDEIKKLIKVNNSNFVEHQRNEHQLRDTIRKKDKEISTMKEENSFLTQKVELLKFEEETDKAVIEKHYKKMDDLKSKVEVQADEKQNLVDEYEEKLEKARTDSKIIIGELKQRVEEFESSSSSLELDLFNSRNGIAELNSKIERLETKVQNEEKNKDNRKMLMTKLENISKTRMTELAHLKTSFQSLKNRHNLDCRFGRDCSRLFCKFNHSFLFRKINVKNVGENLKSCDEVLPENSGLRDHVKRQHEEEINPAECAETHNPNQNKCIETQEKIVLIEHIDASKTRTVDDKTIDEEKDDETFESSDLEIDSSSFTGSDSSASSENSESQSGEDSV